MKTWQTIGIICLFVAFFGMTVFSQEEPERKIVLEVPVELYALHETIQSIVIEAHIKQPVGSYVAEGRTEVPVPPDGDMMQKIIVEAHENEGYDIEAGTQYHVQLFVKLDDGSEAIPLRCSEQAAIDHPGTCLKDGTYYKLNEERDIPQE
jgi:hypothetical protein